MREVVINVRAANEKLRAENQALRRQNTRLRTALLHGPECPLCRLVRCEERDRLIHDAVGWNVLPDTA